MPSKCRPPARSAISPSPSPFSWRGRCGRRRARSRRSWRRRSATIPGVARIDAAPNGYLNLYLDRPRVLPAARAAARSPPAGRRAGKDDRRAHGDQSEQGGAHRPPAERGARRHARRACCASAARRSKCRTTSTTLGVQVADVIVGFRELEHRTLDEVRDDRRHDAVRLLLLGSVLARHGMVRRRQGAPRDPRARRCTTSSTAATTPPRWARSSSIASCARI